MQPTPAGLALLEHARSVLFTMDRIASDAASFSGGLKGHVRLIASASAIAEALLDDIAAFMREPANQNIRVDIEERTSRELVRQVREGNASLGVCWDTVDFEGLAQRPYRQRPPRRSRCTPSTRSRGRKSLRFEQTLAARARRPAALDGGAHHAAARRRARRPHGLVPGHRLQLRRRAARRRRQPRRQRRAARGRQAQRRRRRFASIPLNDAWAERSFAICFRQLEALQPASQRLLAHLEARARSVSTIAR